MPLRRYQIRNECGLGDPELYRAADKDDPEALLEGVAMAGLVGVLRQLGDLAEFAAEIFHDLHEEVMTTAARGHGLMARVQQLEAEFPILEKALLSQTNHSSFFSSPGVVDWHPNLRSEQNLITGGDLPRFVMDSYEECRGPPRLFLLDKFDVAGAGACLKRYTDPSVFKMESLSYERSIPKTHREKRTRKIKKKGMHKYGETPEVTPTHAKLHQLFLEERIENNYNDPARLVKLKKRQLNGSGVDLKSGKSYMEKFLETPSPDNKIICVTSNSSLASNMFDNAHEDAIKILEISTVSRANWSQENDMCSSPKEGDAMLKPSLNLDGMLVGDLNIVQPMPTNELGQTYSGLQDGAVEKKLAADRQNKQEDSLNGYHSDDIASEVDNYMDALTTMESEMETDHARRPRSRYLNNGKRGADADGNDETQPQFHDSQSVENSSLSDENGSFKKNRSNVSFSDTFSSVVDSAPSDGDVAVKLPSSDWSCEPELMYTECTRLHVAVQWQKPECGNSSYALNEGNIFPSLGEASNDSCLTSSFAELLQSDAGADIASAQEMGPQTDEMPSDGVKFHPRLSKTKEDCNQLTENVALAPDDLSLEKNDLSMDSSVILAVDKLDHGYHYQDANFDPVIKFCDISRSIPHSEQTDSSLNEEQQTDIVGESFETLGDRKMQSSEKHLNIVSMEVVNTYSDVQPEDLEFVSNVVKPDGEVSESEDGDLDSVSNVVKHDGEVSKSEDGDLDDVSNAVKSDGEVSKSEYGFIATECTLEEQPLTAGMVQASNLDSQFLLDDPLAGNVEVEDLSALTCTILQVESGSKEIEVLCDDQQLYGEGHHTVVKDEVSGRSNCNVDSVAVDPVCEYQAHLIDHPEQETHESRPDALIKPVDEGDVTSGVAAAECNKDDVDEVMGPVSVVILSPSQNLTGVQESPPALEDSAVKTLQSIEAISVESCEELETQKQLRQPIQSSEILCPINNLVTNSQQSRPEHTDSCNGLRLNKAVPVEFEGQEDMNYQQSNSCTIPSAVGDFTAWQEPQSSFAGPQRRENEVHSTESLSESEAFEGAHLQVVTPDVESMQDGQKTCDTSGSDIYDDNVNGSSAPQLIYMGSDVYVSTTQADISILDNKDSEKIAFCHSHISQCGAVAKASIEHAESGTFLDQSLESMDNLYIKELMKDFGEENLITEQIHSQNPLDHKEHTTFASRSCPETPEEPPVSNFLLDSVMELDQPKQFVYPGEPIIPSLAPLPTHINLDEMPPMPPLPPMQWLGKGQPSSLDSKRELDGDSHVIFKPLMEVRADEQSQIGVRDSHQVLPRENLLFPALDVKSGNPQHAYGFVSGNFGQIVLQFPSTASNFTGHLNYIPIERSQTQNHFQILPSRITEGPSPMYTSSGEEIFQQLNSPLHAWPTENVGNVQNAVSLQEESLPPSSQSVSETGNWGHQNYPQNLGGPTMHSGIISTVPPLAETVQPQNNVLPSETDVLDPSVPTSLSEDGKPSVQGSTKLPRPRNPLIDAVAAHDKSKLRKVTERVRPQLAPKLEERDSLLEQIRTKSFNLKPAVTTRPSIQGPRTNLKVAAILEKANAIRQALTGSDEDDDADSWSDS